MASTHCDVVKTIGLLVKVHDFHCHRLIAARAERPVDYRKCTLSGGLGNGREGEGREQSEI